MVLGAGVLESSDVDARFDSYNRRVRFVGPESPAVCDRWMAQSADALDQIGKIIVYARDDDHQGWEGRGFVREGRINRFFIDGRDATIWSRFIDEKRSRNVRQSEEDAIVELARGKFAGEVPTDLPSELTLRIAQTRDAEIISLLLQQTFSDYPDPVDPETVARWIRDGERLFRLVEHEGRLAACASADVDRVNRSAELTDCATAPDMRGRGLMTATLRSLEHDCMERFGITDTYTLARAGEAGINIAFARLGYAFTGRLVNNCRMPDGWESMNAWCRSA